MSSSECKNGAPPDSERARCLYDRWLLDVPKVLDVAALYGPSNPRLVGQWMRDLFALQPQYEGDVQVCVMCCVYLCICVRCLTGFYPSAEAR